jgi:hypothetical protein
MNDVLKSIGSALRRIYGTVAERPLSWGIIDKLSALDDKTDGAEASEENAPLHSETSSAHRSSQIPPPPHMNGTTARK